MNTYPDCYPCLIRHSAEAIKLTTDNNDQQKSVLRKVLQMMADEPLSVTPVRLTAKIHGIIKSELDSRDYYRTLKDECNNLTMRLLPTLRLLVEQSEDSLQTAAKIAIAGNVIDYGSTGEGFDLEDTIARCQKANFGINHFYRFKADLKTAIRMVYVGDNAGEVAFDRLFIEEIMKVSNLEIIFVVRGQPILNDATLEDARTVGLTDIVPVIGSGGDGPGCELPRATPEVVRHFKKADLIISKGQGNYEALSHEPYNIYFLLKIKCPVIAEDIGCRKGDSVIVSSRKRQ